MDTVRPPWSSPSGGLHTSKVTLECLHTNEDVKVILRAGYLLALLHYLETNPTHVVWFHYCPSPVDPLRYLVLFSFFLWPRQRNMY